MERRIAKKVEQHTIGFKTAIKDYVSKNGVNMVTEETNNNITSDFLRFVFDYSGVELDKEDFQKRKRVKNVVPHCERCIAKRANGEQCTRRRSGTASFCGTHTKGTPHGILTSELDDQIKSKKVEVWVEEIKGINYYIDNEGNVYKHDDVLNNSSNPNVIAKWKQLPDGTYSIPAYGL